MFIPRTGAWILNRNVTDHLESQAAEMYRNQNKYKDHQFQFPNKFAKP